MENTLPDVVIARIASAKGFYLTTTTSARMPEVIRWSSDESSGMRSEVGEDDVDSQESPSGNV